MEANNFKKIFFLFFSLFFIFFALPAKAVCPVCTVAVGACVGLSRYIGIDDSISGLWIGGLVVSLIIWTIDWLTKKNIIFHLHTKEYASKINNKNNSFDQENKNFGVGVYGRKILIVIFYYVIVIAPLYIKDIAGHPFNKLLGIDKLILGIILGSFGFMAAVLFNSWLKKKNSGKVFFPFQKVVIPVAFLLILSLIFYSITC